MLCVENVECLRASVCNLRQQVHAHGMKWKIWIRLFSATLDTMKETTVDVVRSQVDNANDTTLPRGLSDLAQSGRERGVPCQRMMASRSGG